MIWQPLRHVQYDKMHPCFDTMILGCQLSHFLLDKYRVGILPNDEYSVVIWANKLHNMEWIDIALIYLDDKLFRSTFSKKSI